MERNEPPRWMQDKHFNEVLFCVDFLAEYPMVCVGGSFFTVEGHVADEESIRKQIYEMLRPHFTSGTARRATSLLETLKLEAYTPELPIKEDRIHVANGTLFLNGEFRTEKEFCRNRLPIRYDPSAPQPVTWLRFLSDLLEPEDILTLQEYLGYCLIPTNRGQVMMLLKGNGGEGKSRIGVVMQKLLGSNLKNGSIAKVERSPFARADLEHELLMVDDDMSWKRRNPRTISSPSSPTKCRWTWSARASRAIRARCTSGFLPFPTAIWNRSTTTRTAFTAVSSFCQ